MSASISLVLVTHLVSAAVAASAVRAENGPVSIMVGGFIVALLCGLRVCEIMTHRTQLIDKERQNQHIRDKALADGQSALAIADLKALQAQIEPHFLYNTLANLQLLIRQDSARADTMAGHLIDYLRARLPGMREPLTPLTHELDMVKSYLALLQIRMGQRLRFSVDLPPNCARALVPPLVVMTLVENAIQHGLEPKRGGGEVKVWAGLANNWLSVSVADTGVGMGAATGMAGNSDRHAGSGVGLHNVRERLRLQHPGALDTAGQGPRLDLQTNAGGGTSATLHMPAQFEPTQSATAAGPHS